MKRLPSNEDQPAQHTRFVYFAPVDVQVARVDRICVVKFCEAMAEEGADVTLVSAAIKVLPTEPTASRSMWEVFGIQRKFELATVRLPLHQECLTTWSGEFLVKMVRAIFYPVIALRLLSRNLQPPGFVVLYVKNYALVPGLRLIRYLLRQRILLLFEAHVPPRNWFQKRAIGSADGVVCNGYAVHRTLLGRGDVQPKRSMAVHQGFSLGSYPSGARVESRRDARARLGWPESERIAVYTGKMYWPYQEVELLVRAASQLANDGIRLVVVGGRSDHAQRWRDEVRARTIGNVSFAGFVAPADIVDYQVAADVLLSYYPSGINLNDYRSPGKLFEYMASGTPIVAADYPSLREVLENQRNAILVEPDRPELLAGAMRRLMNDPALSARLGHEAQRDAARYTWAKRAEAIAAFAARLEQT